MAALDRIRCRAIPLLEVVVGEVGSEVDVSWHAPVLQLHAATPYDFNSPNTELWNQCAVLVNLILETGNPVPLTTEIVPSESRPVGG